MADSWKPLQKQEMKHYEAINKKNLEFLMDRYNKVNRWVIADMIRRSAYRYPDKPALIFKDRTLTYSQLEADCNRVANALADFGVEKYDRVAILAHNTLDHVLTWIGCAKIGAVYLAINYLLRGKDIAYCINHSESKLFIVEDSLYDLVKDVLNEMPSVKTWIWSRQGAGKPPVSEKFKDFEPWYRAYPATEPDTVLRIEDPVQMTYTSGTESLPKGVIISNQALMAQYMGAIVDGQYDEDDVQVNALPIYHCAQRDVFLNPVFWVGGTNILIAPDMVQSRKNISDYKATMWGIPYDDLDRWRGPYPPDVFAAQFEKVAEGWRAGIAELQIAVHKTPPDLRSEAQADLRLARAAATKFQSVANQTRFVIARDALAKPSNTLSPEQRERLRAEIKRCLESEIALAGQLFTLAQEDSRIGFEPSCQYFYLPLDLVEKVVNCRWLLSLDAVR